MEFVDAGQLVKGNEVRIGGAQVGSVETIKLGDTGMAEIGVSLEGESAPLHEGTTAVIRQQSLSGVANRYVSISPGPNNAQEIPDGGRLPNGRTTAIVDLEALFETFDEDTRRALQKVFAGFAEWWRDNEDSAQRGVDEIAPALQETAKFAAELTSDEPALERFLVQGAAFVGALDAERDSVTDLVSNTNTTLGAIAAENDDFARALQEFPKNMRAGLSTFANLRAAMDDLDPLLKDLRPTAAILPEFLDQFEPWARDARPTMRDLRRTISQPGKNNDLQDLLRLAPALRDAGVPAFKSARSAMADSADVLNFIRPYVPDILSGYVAGFGGNQAIFWDANGRYAHVAPVTGPEGFTDTPPPAGLVAPLLTNLPPLATENDLVPVVAGANQRCPGAATQQAGDGSNPFLDDGIDCNPDHQPPGPGGS